MLNLTAEAKQAWLAQTRQVNARVTIGTAVYNADKIMSVEYDSGSISGETFQIGSFYQNSIKVVLVGILESLANDNKVKLEFAVKVGQAFEWVNMGTFYVTELDRDRNSNRTSFTAADASVYLGKKYAPTISFPNSLKNLVTDIANQCGVQVNFASMTHLADVSVTQPPSKYTCRQVISMVAQIHGGFARINRNDQLEVTRLMSSDIELSPSHYLLKGLNKNETTYRTDGIIVKIGENEEDVLKVGTTTGSAVINLENPLMTQTLLDDMWRVVSIISYYPFNLKWRGIPNLEAGDWITIVDKQGTRYRVPNLSYKLSFKGGLSAESSANTTATSNVQHKLRGTLTQRVEDVEGYINATGGRSYTGLDVPDNKYLKKGDTWYKPDGDDTAILVYDGEKWEEVASPEVFRQLQADFDELDRQAKEAFEQVDTLVQESPETKRLAQEAQEAVNLANQEITKLQTSVNDTKTALENAEQEFADSLATTTRELTAKISGIDVGGRNLARGTHGEYTEEETVNVTVDENLCVFNNKTYLDGLKVGDTVSYKCVIRYTDIVVEDSKNSYARIFVQGNGNVTGWDTGTFDDRSVGTKQIKISGSGEVELKGQFTVTADMLKNQYWNTQIRIDYVRSGKIERKCFKVEKGNMYTDWSPAPEDFQSDLSNTSIELSTKITESAAKLRTEMSEKYSTKNDLTTLSGEYNSFKEETAKKFSQQVSSIQTIQTNTTEAQKLANDAYSKAQNAVTSANSAVSTANTAKNNADKAIADVVSLTKTVSSQSTRIDQTSSRIDQVASGVTEVGNRLSGLKIGSRNLWIINKTTTTGVKETLPDNHITGQKECWRLNNFQGLSFRIEPEFSKRMYGKTFKFSAWVKYENVVKGDNDWNVFNIFKHNLQYKNSVNETITGVDYLTLDFMTGTSDWKKVTYTHTYDRSGFDMLKNSFVFNIESAKSGTAWVTGIQIEEGNIVSDYHLSEEDAQGKLDDINNNLSNNYYAKTTVDSKLSTAVSGITAQYTKDISTQLNNYYDKATMDRRLTIGDVGIETYVKDTKSQLDNVTGFRNLWKHTKDYDGSKYDKWGQIFGGGKIGYKNWKPYTTIDGFGVQYINHEWDDLSQCVPIKHGGTYTLSAMVKLGNSTSSVGIYIDGATIQQILVNGAKQATIKNVIDNLSATEYKRVSVTYKNNGNMDYSYARFEPTTNSTMYMYQPMFNEGYPLPWEPNTDDMVTLSQYTEVKQLADRISSTVYDSASGLVTKTTQLAGKYSIQNLNSYGDVLSSLNMNGGNVRIKGGLIDLDGNVRIQDGFVNNLKANSILAETITAQSTTVVNAKIANLDASYITSGFISSDRIAVRSLDATKIKSKTITAEEIQAGSITGTEIKAETITSAHIAAAGINADKIKATTLSSITANIGTVTAGTIKSASGSFVIDVTNGTISSKSGSNNVYISSGELTMQKEGKTVEMDANGLVVKNKNYRSRIQPEVIDVNGAVYASDYFRNTNTYVPFANIVQSGGNSSSKVKELLRLGGTDNPYLHIGTDDGNYGVSLWHSDEKLKENIYRTNDEEVLGKIKKVNVYSFDWKADGTHTDYGFVAQDIQKTFPQSVFDVDGTLNINVSGIVPPMLGAIKALSKRVDILQGENQLLKARLESIQ